MIKIDLEELDKYQIGKDDIDFYRYHDNIVSTSMLIPAEERDIRGFELVGFKEFERGPRNIYLKEF